MFMLHDGGGGVCKQVAKAQLAGDKVQNARGVAGAKPGPNDLAKLPAAKNGQEMAKNQAKIEAANHDGQDSGNYLASLYHLPQRGG